MQTLIWFWGLSVTYSAYLARKYDETGGLNSGPGRAGGSDPLNNGSIGKSFSSSTLLPMPKPT